MSEHPLRFTITSSVISSLIVSAFAAGGTWAALSNRVADAQTRAIAAEARVTSQEQRNAAQDTAIAVAQQQFQEILRRLNVIEAKIDDNKRK